MRIHCMSLVKNECDIVAQSLTAAAAWADAIYVYDNGSEDGTWEIVGELASTHPEIVPFKQDPTPFSQALRREIFEAFRDRSVPGDWWCLLDADEFYIDDPLVFLPRVPESYDEVWSASFEYYFTDRDAARYAEDPGAYADDVPVAEKCRYFLNNYSEPRFFRHTERLEWREGTWPENLGPTYRKRIRLKHFQYRSPEQIEKRIRTRREAFARGGFLHEQLPDWQRAVLDPERADHTSNRPEYAPTSWRDRVLPASLLLEDAGDGPYVVNEAALGPIPRWRPTWERWLRARARPLKRVLRRSSVL